MLKKNDSNNDTTKIKPNFSSSKVSQILQESANIPSVDDKKQRINNILRVEGGVAFIGAITGAIYSHRTGGGFWRGVGYFILGSLVFGTATRIITTPFKNKILKEK